MRNLIIANIVLAALIAWGGVKVKRDWTQFQVDYDVGKIQAAAELKKQVVTRTPAASRADDSREVAENNIFSFDRNDIALKPPPAAVAAKPSGPKPILFGTMVIGGPRMAMLGPGLAGNRAYRPMVVGEVIDGWKLIQVNDKSVVVESAGFQETVLMNDPTAQVPRDYSRTTMSAQGQATAAVVRQPPAQSQQPTPTASQQPAASSPSGPPPKTRVINTPFGKVVITDPE